MTTTKPEFITLRRDALPQLVLDICDMVDASECSALDSEAEITAAIIAAGVRDVEVEIKPRKHQLSCNEYHQHGGLDTECHSPSCWCRVSPAPLPAAGVEVPCKQCVSLQATIRRLTRQLAEPRGDGVLPCFDHWHCDPKLAAHACSGRDRTKPCPNCATPPLPASAGTEEESAFEFFPAIGGGGRYFVKLKGRNLGEVHCAAAGGLWGARRNDGTTVTNGRGSAACFGGREAAACSLLPAPIPDAPKPDLLISTPYSRVAEVEAYRHGFRDGQRHRPEPPNVATDTTEFDTAPDAPAPNVECGACGGSGVRSNSESASGYSPCRCVCSNRTPCERHGAHVAPAPPAEPERIVGPAFLDIDTNQTWHDPIPASHYSVSQRMIAEGIQNPLARTKYEQGFWTSRDRFVRRKPAKRIAEAAGQIVNPISGSADLFSEELWPHAPAEPKADETSRWRSGNTAKAQATEPPPSPESERWACDHAERNPNFDGHYCNVCKRDICIKCTESATVEATYCASHAPAERPPSPTPDVADLIERIEADPSLSSGWMSWEGRDRFTAIVQEWMAGTANAKGEE